MPIIQETETVGHDILLEFIVTRFKPTKVQSRYTRSHLLPQVLLCPPLLCQPAIQPLTRKQCLLVSNLDAMHSPRAYYDVSDSITEVTLHFHSSCNFSLTG